MIKCKNCNEDVIKYREKSSKKPWNHIDYQGAHTWFIVEKCPCGCEKPEPREQVIE